MIVADCAARRFGDCAPLQKLYAKEQCHSSGADVSFSIDAFRTVAQPGGSAESIRLAAPNRRLRSVERTIT
jgi:hypothetical protein